MNGSVHKIAGIVTGIIVYQYWIPYFWIAVSLAIIGASIPDLDRIIPGFHHRGIMHTLFFAILFCVLPFKLILLFQLGITQDFELALFAGYISHLILDSFTHMGVMWLYPFSKTRI